MLKLALNTFFLIDIAKMNNNNFAKRYDKEIDRAMKWLKREAALAHDYDTRTHR